MREIGLIDLSENRVIWNEDSCSKSLLSPQFERRLLHSAASIGNVGDVYCFDHLCWNSGFTRPMTIPVVVEKSDADKAQFRMGDPEEFCAEALLGSVAKSAFEKSRHVFLLTDVDPSHFPGPRIIYVSEAFSEITGYMPSDVIGKTPRILQSELTEAEPRAQMRQAFSNWEAVNCTLTNVTKEGKPFRIELEIVPITDRIGWYTHWFALQRDITAEERKALEDQEIYHQAGMAQVATDLIHSIGNDINSVGVATSSALQRLHSGVFRIHSRILESDDVDYGLTADMTLKEIEAKVRQRFKDLSRLAVKEQESYVAELEGIKRSIKSINRLINTQANTAQRPIDEQVSIRSSIEKALGVSKQSGRFETVHVDIVVQDDLPLVKADRMRVVMILTNLFKNALQAVVVSGNQEPELKIEAFAKNGFVFVAVEDNGEGISSDDLTRVFNSGFSGNTTSAGNGLHFASIAAYQLGGTIEAASEGKNRGAKFTLKLPYQG